MVSLQILPSLLPFSFAPIAYSFAALWAGACLFVAAVHVRRFPWEWEVAWTLACSICVLQLLLLHQVVLLIAASRS